MCIITKQIDNHLASEASRETEDEKFFMYLHYGNFIMEKSINLNAVCNLTGEVKVEIYYTDYEKLEWRYANGKEKSRVKELTNRLDDVVQVYLKEYTDAAEENYSMGF
jgi:hypothetical protein